MFSTHDCANGLAWVGVLVQFSVSSIVNVEPRFESRSCTCSMPCISMPKYGVVSTLVVPVEEMPMAVLSRLRNVSVRPTPFSVSWTNSGVPVVGSSPVSTIRGTVRWTSWPVSGAVLPVSL